MFRRFLHFVVENLQTGLRGQRGILMSCSAIHIPASPFPALNPKLLTFNFQLFTL